MEKNRSICFYHLVEVWIKEFINGVKTRTASNIQEVSVPAPKLPFFCQGSLSFSKQQWDFVNICLLSFNSGVHHCFPRGCCFSFSKLLTLSSHPVIVHTENSYDVTVSYLIWQHHWTSVNISAYNHTSWLDLGKICLNDWANRGIWMNSKRRTL